MYSYLEQLVGVLCVLPPGCSYQPPAEKFCIATWNSWWRYCVFYHLGALTSPQLKSTVYSYLEQLVEVQCILPPGCSYQPPAEKYCE